MTDAKQAAYEDRMRSDPRTVEELISAALRETDETVAWQAVCALHFRGTDEVLRRANELCHSSNIAERRLGANMLGQLGVPERTFPNECLAILLGMLSGESDALRTPSQPVHHRLASRSSVGSHGSSHSRADAAAICD